MSKLRIFSLILSCGVSIAAQASFTQNTKRYVSSKDLYNLLYQRFPVLNEFNSVTKIKPECWSQRSTVWAVNGAVIPALSVPASQTPSPGFVRWWSGCVDEIVRNQVQQLKNQPRNEKLFARYFCPQWLDRFKDPARPDQPFHRLFEIKWQALNGPTREAQIRFLIEEWIGPNTVIADLGFAKGIGEVSAALAGGMAAAGDKTLDEAAALLMVGTLLREEFLTY